MSIKLEPFGDSPIWETDSYITKLRKRVYLMVAKLARSSSIKFDEQDLEHQILFRATTFPKKKINLSEIIKEQKEIVFERMKKVDVKPKELFCFGLYRTNHGWQMEWRTTQLYAVNKNTGQKKKVYFREITDRKIGSDIIENYHYIHCSRNNENGLMFGFFLEDSKTPFAVEQVEPCSNSKNYKKAMLMLNDINYHSCCELTRFYSVPNSPKNLISILDRLVGEELRKKGFEWMMTATMPKYAKTKASTVSGGIDKPIFGKKTPFTFFERPDGKYQLCVSRNKPNAKTITSRWGITKTIEFIKPLVGKYNNVQLDFYLIK